MLKREEFGCNPFFSRIINIVLFYQEKMVFKRVAFTDLKARSPAFNYISRKRFLYFNSSR